MTSSTLDEQARDFAENLTRTVRALVPDCAEFDATRVESKNGHDRVWVRQDPVTGIPLRVNGRPVLTLKVEFFCCLDSSRSHLAVDESSISVYPGRRARQEPLFRYDYLRQSSSEIPAAHLQVHAHRDAFTHVMGQAGEGTSRGKRRSRSDDVPRLAELHFP